MKFNRNQGALVGDEMSWHLGFKYGYRPSRYGDQILNLLDGNSPGGQDFSAVYAGVGFPSLHFEVARLARKALAQKEGNACDLDRTGEMVQDVFQQVHARMINDKLRFFFGLDRDELNRLKFTFDGKEYTIGQESVINEAKKILKYQDKSEAYHRIFDNEGLLMGYDKENGIRAYHVSNEGRGLDFAYPFDALGYGKEIGTKVFADTSYRMHLDERRKGFSLSDGLFLLMNGFVEAYDFNNKTGGYIQVVFIDGAREYFDGITGEVNDHRAFLSAEVIRAYRWGYIGREAAQDMVFRLLVKGEEWEPLEAELFAKASDPAALKKHLMGFKPSHTPVSPLD
jgi:20S proteasome alpha/beta subunit